MVRNYVTKVLGKDTNSSHTDDTVPELENLFAISPVYTNMESEIGFESSECAALCFAIIDTEQFDTMIENIRELLTGDEGTVRIVSDVNDYQWIVLDGMDYESLATNIHFVADQFVESGYETRLLASVYAFEKQQTDMTERAYWVYSFRRHAYYPFVPLDDKQRNSALEFKMKSLFSELVPLEADKQHWYPLWSNGDTHPWGG